MDLFWEREAQQTAARSWCFLWAACGECPGSAAGRAWCWEHRSRPGKEAGEQNPLAFDFVAYSRVKSKDFLFSGAVRGPVLVWNRAAFLWDLSLSHSSL